MIARTAGADRGLLGGAFAVSHAWFAAVREAWAKRRAYLDTVAQLRAMTDRDLADIGISRHAIGEIAGDAIYGR